jgi:hypothetical protein
MSLTNHPSQNFLNPDAFRLFGWLLFGLIAQLFWN